MRFCIIILALALLTISCGNPRPVGFPYSEQMRLEAGHHWDVLAADIANQINNELLLNDYLDIPVFVRETCGNENQPCKPSETTVFEESFRDLLVTNLVALGVPTSPNGDSDSIVINYKVQTVYIAGTTDSANPSLITSSNFKVIITTSVVADSHYLFRNSNIYYIYDQDSWHYRTPSSLTDISLTSNAAPSSEVKGGRKSMVVEPQPIIPLISEPDSTGI